MRYAISGANTVAVSGGSGSATGIVQWLMGEHGAVTTGRVFWLTGFWTGAGHGTEAYISLHDATAAGATTQGTTWRAAIRPPTAAGVYDGAIVSFAPPGIKFTTGVAVRIGATLATGSAAYAVGALGGCGYEE